MADDNNIMPIEEGDGDLNQDGDIVFDEDILENQNSSNTETDSTLVGDTVISVNVSSSAEIFFSELEANDIKYFLKDNEIYCLLPTFTVEETESSENSEGGNESVTVLKTYNALNIRTGETDLISDSELVTRIKSINISCITE